MRARGDGAGRFVAVEPRLSLTGANADEWVAIKPGSEMALALGMAHVIVDRRAWARGGGADRRRGRGVHARGGRAADRGAGRDRAAAGARVRRARARASRSPAASRRRASRRCALLAAVNLLNYVAGNVGADGALRSRARPRRGRLVRATLQRLIADAWAQGERRRAGRARREPGLRGAGVGGLRGRDGQGAVQDLARRACSTRPPSAAT